MPLSRRSFLGGLAASGLAIASLRRARAEPDAVRVSVADFGARPDGADARPGVQAAIARLPRTGGAVLHFPPGVYRFGEGQDRAIRLSGIDNFTLDASGCTFLFAGVAFPIELKGCRNVRLQGFAIDWERPPFSQGEVIASNVDGRSIDVRIDSEFPVDGSETFHALGTYDRELGQMARAGVDAYNVVNKVALIGDQKLRLGLARRVRLSPGAVIVLRHEVPSYAHAITLMDCDGVQVDSVRVSASCSMALVGSRCRNILVTTFEVKPKPGSGRLLSTNADAIHLSRGSGTVDIRDCLLTGMGDDCINVHGQFLRVVELRDSRTALVANQSERPFGPDDLPRPGDRFALARGGSLQPLGDAIVAGAEAGPHEILHFSADLPKGLSPGDLVCDSGDLAALTISRCRFPGNRARGILAHSNAVIEGCSFSHQSEQAILLTPDMFWMECGSADRVKIRNNEIRDAMRLRRKGQGAITIDAMIIFDKHLGHSNELVNHDVLIADNAIEDCGGSAVAANAVDGLMLENNRIEQPAGPAVTLGAVRQVTMRGNRCTPSAAVTVLPQYRSEVTMSNNIGLQL